MLDQSVRQCALSFVWLFDTTGFCTVEELVETVKARFIVVGFGFATILLSLFRHRFGAAGQAEILRSAKEVEMADVKQMKKIIPLITCEVFLCQYVCELVFGVDILDLNFGVQINSVKPPVKSNSVGSGHVSHCWTSAF